MDFALRVKLAHIRVAISETAKMVAIYEYFGYDLPIAELFSLIRAVGFDAVGLWRDDAFGWVGHRDAPDLARRAGLEVIDGHGPFVREEYDVANSLWLDNLDGETTFQIYRRAIEECGEDGIANIVLHAEVNYDKYVSPPPSELGITRIRKLADFAQSCGVTIALENCGHDEYLRYIFDRVDSPHLGLCYDSGHKNLAAQDVDLLTLYGDRLACLHLHDNNGARDEHLLPMHGSIDWQSEMAKIAQTGYRGPVTLESSIGVTVADTKDTTQAEVWLRRAFDVATQLEHMHMTSIT